MNLDKLKKLKKELLSIAEQQKKEVDAWGDTPTDEQRSAYDALVQKFAEIEADIKREETRLADVAKTKKEKENVMQQLAGLQAEAETTADPPFIARGETTLSGDGNVRIKSYHERYDEKDFMTRMWEHGTAALLSGSAKDAEIFYKEGAITKRDEQYITRAITTTQQGGGVMIPHRILQLMRRAMPANVLREICAVIETGRNNTIPVEAAIVDLPAVVEGGEHEEKTNAIILDNTVDIVKWGAYYVLSQEAIDENYNLESLVMNYAIKTLAVQEQKTLLAALLAQAQTGLTKADTELDFQELVSLRSLIPEEDHDQATYLFSNNLREEITRMEDSTGRPFFPSEVFVSGVKYLHGRPFRTSSFFPSGNDAKIGLVGNFSRVVIGEPPNSIHITIDRFTRAKEGAVEIIFNQSGGIKLVDTGAVKAIANSASGN